MLAISSLVLFGPVSPLADTGTVKSGTVIACLHPKIERFTGQERPGRCYISGYPGRQGRQRVSVPGSEPCPEWLEEAPPLGPGRPKAVELEGLREVTVCRYLGNPNNANGPDLPPNNKLAIEKVVDQPHTARSLARAFNRLRPYPLQDAPYPDGQPPMLMCSPEFGGGFYLRFLYSDGRRSSVKVGSGCPWAIAGKKGGFLLVSGDLQVRLEKIAPWPRAGDGPAGTSRTGDSQ